MATPPPLIKKVPPKAPTKVSDKTSTKISTGPSTKLKSPVKKPLFLRLKVHDKVGFAKYLSVMLDAGIPLHESLGVLTEQISQPTLQYVLQIAIADLADGLPLHTSLAKFPKLFDDFFISSMSIGEASGTLASSLRFLAAQLEKSQELSGKVRAALLYPAIVFSGAIGIGIYLAFFMLPKILPLFISLKVKLPATTLALLASSHFIAAYWPWLLAGLVVLVVLSSLLVRIAAVRFALYTLLLSVPVFGRLTREIQTAKFSRILGTLLNSGVTIVPALNVTSASTDNPVYKKELLQIAIAVERGETIGDELRKYNKLFSRTTMSMVGIGERTGKLSDSLISLAQFSESEVDSTTQNLSTLIEPLTLIFVGLLVGFIALSIITPIYQITQGIHA